MNVNELMINIISKEIGQAALWEQLAEECTELAKEALKYARIIRHDNPTPVTRDEVAQNVIEEYNDIQLVAQCLEIPNDVHQQEKKLTRWFGRVTSNKDLSRFDITDMLGVEFD